MKRAFAKANARTQNNRSVQTRAGDAAG